MYRVTCFCPIVSSLSIVVYIYLTISVCLKGTLIFAYRLLHYFIYAKTCTGLLAGCRQKQSQLGPNGNFCISSCVNLYSKKPHD